MNAYQRAWDTPDTGRGAEWQELIDSGERFRLQGYDGEVSLEDMTAAGGPMVHFHFHGGPLDGKVLVLEGWDPKDGFLYNVNNLSDGFEFNIDPRRKEAYPELEDYGGDYVPEYNWHIFYLDNA